jgi:hypothetical protein
LITNESKNEDKMISFLESTNELLGTSLKKINGNKNIAGLSVFKPNLKSKDAKYLIKKKHEVPDVLQSFINNTFECPLCNKHKVFDESLQCSRIEDPKSSA